jgi:hypothetical protein
MSQLEPRLYATYAAFDDVLVFEAGSCGQKSDEAFIFFRSRLGPNPIFCSTLVEHRDLSCT